MATLEERVAFLEGKVEEHSKAFVDLRDAIMRLEQRMDARFVAVDARFVAVDARFDRLDQRMDRLEDRMARQFLWIIGIQITTLVAMVSAVLGAVVLVRG